MGRHEEYVGAERHAARALVLERARAQGEHCREAAFVHHKKRRKKRDELRRLATLGHLLVRRKLAVFCLHVDPQLPA